MTMTADASDLILQHLENLRADLAVLRSEVQHGFEKVNGRLGKLENRMVDVEKWQERHDAAGTALDNQRQTQQANQRQRFTGAQLLLAVMTTAVIVASYLQLILK